MTVTKTIQIKSESQLGRDLEYIINAKKNNERDPSEWSCFK